MSCEIITTETVTEVIENCGVTELVETLGVFEVIEAGIQGVPGPAGPQGPAGPSGSVSSIVVDQVPTGLINGSNATFTTPTPFVPETVDPFLNGVRQHRPDDYNTSGNNTIQLTQSPGVGERLTVNYFLL
jgi:hypothetical protein